MKNIIILFLFANTVCYSQDYPYYGWYDVVVERSVEHLHKTLSSSNDITDNIQLQSNQGFSLK